MMTTFLPSSVAAATARFTATVVRPTPPFGLKTATTMPGSPGSPVRVPFPTTGRGGRDGHDRHAALLVALAGIDLTDRGGELVAAERLDQELPGPGQHRTTEVVGLALDGHHDDGRGWDCRRELLGGGDAVHVGHVDVHQDDVGVQAGRPSRAPRDRTPQSRPRRCRSRIRGASSGGRGSLGCRRRRGHGSGRPSRSDCSFDVVRWDVGCEWWRRARGPLGPTRPSCRVGRTASGRAPYGTIGRTGFGTLLPGRIGASTTGGRTPYESSRVFSDDTARLGDHRRHRLAGRRVDEVVG